MPTKAQTVAFYERLLAPLLNYDDATGDGCVSLEVRSVILPGVQDCVCGAEIVSARGPFTFKVARLLWPEGMVDSFGLARPFWDEPRIRTWVEEHGKTLAEGLHRLVLRRREDRDRDRDRAGVTAGSVPVYIRVPAPAGGVVLRGALLGLCATDDGGDSSSSSDVSLLEEQVRRLQAERDEVEERARRRRSWRS